MINEAQYVPGEEERNYIGGLGIAEKLQEGTDYYINQDGNFVMTRWYLLRRAYCCKNACKNCPY